MPIARPPRLSAHAERDVLIARFRAKGLIARVSTNGSIPDADIQQVKGEKPGEVPEVWLTEIGKRRLGEA